MKSKAHRHEASFRDPSGFIFEDGGTVKRAINPIYFPVYQALCDNDFFAPLFKAKMLIPHVEEEQTPERIVLKPDQLDLMTYPYEWSFDQFKQAALLTLKLQNYALERGFSLKDASAYNVTFHKGRAIFIDTLSFDFYQKDQPWRAYKQFVMHFLSPLVLAHYHGAEVLKMMQNHIDGIPVSLVASLLPKRTKLSPTLYTNIHLLAKLEAKHNDEYKPKSRKMHLSKKALSNMIRSLYDYIDGLELKQQTEWGDYYNKTNYQPEAFSFKKQQIDHWISQRALKKVLDVGGNDGTFVRALTEDLDLAVVADIDHNAVALNYAQVKANKEHNILPLWFDVAQPSPGIGWVNQERSPILNRLSKWGPEVVLALAVIHHMTLSGNVPFEDSARFFAGLSPLLIIEFPKRKDSWVDSLLQRKREFINHFDHYHQEDFESAFAQYFETLEQVEIPGSKRILYLMKTRS
ncbi:MAG: class I SAM-dependent methyltransferase [Flavobacteriaceae bacterium]|nr:class I SAM-dependent methyltransferase [Flavobacteriaceae bacterium]